MSNNANSGAPEYLEGPGLSDEELGRVPVWPKVIGIISISWGTLGLCCAGLGAFGFWMMGVAASQAASDPKAAMPDVYANVPVAMWAQIGIGVLMALFLLVSGILLVMRSYPARMMHLVYGVLGVLTAAWGVFLQLQMQEQVDAWCAANPDTMFAQNNASAGAITKYLGVGIGLVFGMGYPIFCLIWFGLVKKTRESMTGGVEAAA